MAGGGRGGEKPPLCAQGPAPAAGLEVPGCKIPVQVQDWWSRSEGKVSAIALQFCTEGKAGSQPFPSLSKKIPAIFFSPSSFNKSKCISSRDSLSQCILLRETEVCAGKYRSTS